MIKPSRRAVVFALTAGALLSPVAAAAHRGHSALSVVEFDARTGAVTVSHRFQTHDAEPALAEIAPAAQTSLDDPDAVKALTAYVGARFAMAVKGAGVDLVLKDMTLGADDVRMVYTGQIPLSDVLGQIDIKAVMFVDIYPDQVNQVNIRRGGPTRTLVFEGKDAQVQSLIALD
ncbi:hypothetical protein BH10PSE3_BH10PSE3_05870 [soil metagenome]